MATKKTTQTSKAGADESSASAKRSNKSTPKRASSKGGIDPKRGS